MNRERFQLSWKMDRLQWLKELSKIFDKHASSTVPKSSVLSELALLPITYAINQDLRDKLISFSEIYDLLLSIPGDILAWENIPESLIYLSEQQKTETKESIQDSQEITPQKVLDMKNSRKNMHFLYFPKDHAKIYSHKFSENMLYLNLSGNNLIHVYMNFPHSLKVLNVSSNLLRRFNAKSSLNNLEFLNISCNRLQNLSGINAPKLSEIYASHNELSMANELSVLNRLAIVDLSYNKIDNFEGIQNLFSLKLKALNLVDNPIKNHSNWISGIEQLSKFRNVYEIAFKVQEETAKLFEISDNKPKQSKSLHLNPHSFDTSMFAYPSLDTSNHNKYSMTSNYNSKKTNETNKTQTPVLSSIRSLKFKTKYPKLEDSYVFSSYLSKLDKIINKK